MANKYPSGHSIDYYPQPIQNTHKSKYKLFTKEICSMLDHNTSLRKFQRFEIEYVSEDSATKLVISSINKHVKSPCLEIFPQ